MSDAADASTPIWQRNLWGHSDVTGSDGVTRRTHERRDGNGTWLSPDDDRARLTLEHCGVWMWFEIPRPTVGEIASIGRVVCPRCGEVCWSSDPADFPWGDSTTTGEGQ